MGFWTIGDKEIHGSYQVRLYFSTESIQKLQEITDWLSCNFGKPPLKPILRIKPDDFLHEKDTAVVIYCNTNTIIGTVRHKYLSNDIYLIDCFCVHHTMRGKNVADLLLHTIKEYANHQGFRRAVFLKEGAPLFIPHLPMYSSTYLYRRTEFKNSRHILSIPSSLAHRLVDIYRRMYPSTFILLNNTVNQYWRLYRTEGHSILACFQDTNQYMNSKSMGFVTVWLESGSSCIHATNIIDSVHSIFDYVWIDSKNVMDEKGWKSDGSFHWYSYQWTNKMDVGAIMI
jgi:GNAT superfamily N-acetyltransferase